MSYLAKQEDIHCSKDREFFSHKGRYNQGSSKLGPSKVSLGRSLSCSLRGLSCKEELNHKGELT